MCVKRKLYLPFTCSNVSMQRKKKWRNGIYLRNNFNRKYPRSDWNPLHFEHNVPELQTQNLALLINVLVHLKLACSYKCYILQLWILEKFLLFLPLSFSHMHIHMYVWVYTHTATVRLIGTAVILVSTFISSCAFIERRPKNNNSNF